MASMSRAEQILRNAQGAKARAREAVAGARRAMSEAQASRPRLKADTGSGFDAGRSSRRLIKWAPTRQSINSLLLCAGDTVIARARHLVRNNPYAANAMESFVANAVGTGIKPSSTIREKELKADVHRRWALWGEEADADGVTNFYGMQQLATRALFEAGECFIRFRPRRPSDGLSVPMQLQLLEAEQLPYNSFATPAGLNTIRLGIEFNPIGRRVAYHFLAVHPGDVLNQVTGINPMETRRIPAEEILHLYRPLRPGQIRGQPQITPSMVKLFVQDKYDDAEAERKMTTAMYVAFLTKPQSDADVLNEVKDPADEEGTARAGLEPGTMQILLPGEEIEFSKPADVGGSYEAFQYRQLTAAAAGVGIPYFNMTGDLAGANYSSMRAGLVEFRRRMEQFQQLTLVFQLCRPVWRRWFETAVLSGALTVPGFVEDRESSLGVNWIAPRWPWVDPLKDRQAEALALKIGTKSRTQAVREEGSDIEELDREIAMDKERERELGLSFENGIAAAGTVAETAIPATDAQPPGKATPPVQDEGAQPAAAVA